MRTGFVKACPDLEGMTRLGVRVSPKHSEAVTTRHRLTTPRTCYLGLISELSTSIPLLKHDLRSITLLLSQDLRFAFQFFTQHLHQIGAKRGAFPVF